MAYQGINQRATGGYVTDGTGETYSLGEAYPTTRGGQTFGWSVNNAASSRDRTAVYDRRVAGTSGIESGTIDFKMDLASVGVGTIRLAMGDVENATNPYVELLDDGVVFHTFSGTASGSTLMVDATGVARRWDISVSPSWVADNVAVTHTFTSTNFTVRLGDSTARSTRLAHVSVDIAAADTAAPTVSSAVVANSTPSVVTLTMSEAMDSGFIPSAGAFTVTGHTVSSVGISGSVISLTCSSPFANGEAARTVSYTQPGTNNARDAAGNLLANFSGTAITNNVAAADSTPPAFGSAQVANANPDKIVITMSEALAASTPATSAFTASGGKTVTAVAIAGNQVTVTVNTPYIAGNTITIAYTQPGANPRLQDATGNLTATFAAQSVTNNIGVAAGTFKTHPIVNNTGSVPSLYKNASVDYVNLYNPATGDKLLRRTTQTTDSTGVVTITDAAIVGATNYEYSFKMADGAKGFHTKASEA